MMPDISTIIWTLIVPLVLVSIIIATLRKIADNDAKRRYLEQLHRKYRQ